LLQFGQVVEGIGIAELARVDQAHEQVPNMGAILGFVEECRPSLSACSIARIACRNRCLRLMSNLFSPGIRVADWICRVVESKGSTNPAISTARTPP
jgi:hypothetical protein